MSNTTRDETLERLRIKRSEQAVITAARALVEAAIAEHDGALNALETDLAIALRDLDEPVG